MNTLTPIQKTTRIQSIDIICEWVPPVDTGGTSPINDG